MFDEQDPSYRFPALILGLRNWHLRQSFAVNKALTRPQVLETNTNGPLILRKL